MIRLNPTTYLIAAAATLLLCTCSPMKPEAEASVEFKKLKPFEAEAWKWSAPDADWDAWHAAHLLDEVDRWKHEHTTQGAGARNIEGEWRLEGPKNIGGRFNFIRQHPDDPVTLFAGSSAGGWDS